MKKPVTICATVAALLLSAGPSWGYLVGPYNAEIIDTPNWNPLYADGMTYFNGNIYVMLDYPRRFVQVDRNTGAIVATWNCFGGVCPGGGMANDGTKMYACNRDTIFTVSLGAPPDSVCTPIASIAEYYPAVDLVYGDGLLWVPIYLAYKINKYDPISGAMIGSIPSPSGFVYSMAFDGTNLILADYVDSLQMWKVSTTGEVLDSWAVPARLDNWAFGMAYDFSTETLLISPEPATLALLGLGGLGMLLRRRRR